MVKQFHLQQTADKADWLIGAGLLAEGIKGQGLRSMSAPGTAHDDPPLGKDPQPASMKDYIQTKEDNGGVHSTPASQPRLLPRRRRRWAASPGESRLRLV
ncbi:peptidase M4 family protein [Serratia ureilytica]